MKYLSTAYLLPFIFSASLYFSDDFTSKISKKLVEYQQALPQEKAYLQTDKPYYTVGDTIWLKTFLVVSNQLLPDTISKTIYVDLVDENTGKTVDFKRLPLKNGMAQGQFVLNDSTLNGSYQIRAYNNWMRNFSEEMVFRKKIKIFNEKAIATMPDTTLFDIQFFPEGGNLVSGLNNRIAFKAVNALGKSTNIEGFILSSTSDTITAFVSSHLGMGYFNLTPEPQKIYQAMVKKTNGKWIKFELPSILEQGIAVQVDNFSNKTNVRAIISNNLKVSENEIATIVVYGQGEIRLVANLPLSKKVSLVNIPRAVLGDGMSFITVFDSKQNPVCERLFWSNKVQPLKVTIKTNKNEYKPKEKVDVEVLVLNQNNQPVEANFLVSVSDQNQVSGLEPYNQNLLSYMHLTSDLKGAIENPSYYFDSTKTQAAFHLDYLMLTQGWRRFKWKEILADTLQKPKYFIEQGISVRGNVLKMNGKNAGKVNLDVMITDANEEKTMIKSEANSDGSFELTNLNYKDSVEFFIQAATQKDNRDLMIKLEDFVSPKFNSQNIYNESNGIEESALKSYLERMFEYRNIESKIKNSGEKLLQEVVVKAQKTVAKDTRKIYTTASNTMTAEQLKNTSALSTIEALQNRIPGVQVTGTYPNFKVNIRAATNFGGAIEPLYLLDGMYSDMQAILNTPISNVESIDVLKQGQASMFGSRGAGGVIAVYTKKGNPNYDVRAENAPGTLMTKLKGYDSFKEFYSPKYAESVNVQKPDFRSTLYWNPSVQTDKNGKATFSFYNSDATTSVYMNIEGMSQQGQIGVNTAQYLVK